MLDGRQQELSSRPAVVIAHDVKWRTRMDREHVKGAADKAKGAIKDTLAN
jgi:hypothetical protein